MINTKKTPLATCWPAHPHPHTLHHLCLESYQHLQLASQGNDTSDSKSKFGAFPDDLVSISSLVTPFLVFIWSQISLVWVRRWKDSCFAARQDGCCLRDVDCNVVNLSFVAKCNFPQAFVMATLSKKQIYDARSQWEILKSIQTLSTSLTGCRIRMLFTPGGLLQLIPQRVGIMLGQLSFLRHIQLDNLELGQFFSK